MCKTLKGTLMSLKNIFALNNSSDRRHKVLTLFGIKIKFKTADYTEFDSHNLKGESLKLLTRKINPKINDEKSILKMLKENDIISFDIFDTLLIRPYVKPTDMFFHMEELYNCPEFATARIEAEQRARNKYSHKEDITLDDIYEEILPKYLKLKNCELNFEKTILKPHPENYKIYNWAKELNKKIIITSDMYLPENFIREVLIKNGYDKFDKIYISSEYAKSKGSGTLFEQILKDYNIDLSNNKSNVLHIGDNDISDVKNPLKYGIHTLKVIPYIEKFALNPENKKYVEYYNSNQTLQRSILIAMIAQHQINSNSTYWQEIGFSLGGPLAVGYIQKIINEIELNGIDSLLFVARDGYILQKVYQMLSDNPIENNYIYAPRVLNLTCFADYRNNEAYLRNLIELLKNIIPEIKLHKNFDDNKKELTKHKEVIIPWLRKNQNEYKKYIETLNMKGVHIASVDMTTGAFTSSTFLNKFFKERFCLGFYSGTLTVNKNIKYISYAQNNFKVSDFPILNLTELLISSAEPPIKNIKNSKPIYEEINDFEAYRIDIIKEIHKGILDFVTMYKTLFRDYHPFWDFNSLYALLNFYLNELTSNDRAMLKKVYHSGDILNKEYQSLYNTIKNR